MTYLLRGMPIGLIFSVAASAVGVYRTDQPAEKEGRRAASSRYSAAFAASRCWPCAALSERMNKTASWRILSPKLFRLISSLSWALPPS